MVLKKRGSATTGCGAKKVARDDFKFVCLTEKVILKTHTHTHTKTGRERVSFDGFDGGTWGREKSVSKNIRFEEPIRHLCGNTHQTDKWDR